MSDRQGWIDDDIVNYIAERARPRPDAALGRLQKETAAFGHAAEMQVSGDEGVLLTMLTRLVGASFAVEVGTFTGFSSICIARGLLPGGRLLCCDVSEKFTAVARRAWVDAGVDDRIELRLAPALETLRSLPEGESIDFAFIDADKENYVEYFEEIVTRLRPRGLIVADNTLYSGRVVGAPGDDDRSLSGIRRFNDAIAADERVDSCILPVRDGVTLITRNR